MSRFRELVAAALVVAAAAPSSASPLSVYFSDNSGGGTTSVVASPSNDGNGSLQLSTPSGGKSFVALYSPGATPGSAMQLGTLGQLTSATFDYYKSSTSTTAPNSAPAVRFFLSPSFTSPALVWERAYQNVSQTTPTDAWQNDVQLLGTNELWERAGHNFDQIVNLHTKDEWTMLMTPPTDGAFVGTVLSADTPVYGVGISFGSGVSGNFLGYVDDIQLRFSNGTTYSADFALAPVPEPATVAALGLMTACGGLYVRRRKSASA